jgi:hypothetical protein
MQNDLRFVRQSVPIMSKEDFKKKFDYEGSLANSKNSYLDKPLREWNFQDLLHFFKTSVTNDKKCIDTIRIREVTHLRKPYRSSLTLMYSDPIDLCGAG